MTRYILLGAFAPFLEDVLMMMVAPIRVLAFLVCFTALASGADGNWPSFRGRNGSGIGSGSPPIRWDVKTGESIRWKTPIPGLAHSSPIIWGDRIFLTTAVSSRTDAPELKTGWLNGTGDSPAESEPWTWKLLALDRASGRIVWSQDASSGVPKRKRHLKATHANCTPATDGKRVVAFFGSEGLYSYSVEGKLLWKKDLGVLESGPYNAPELEWGFASSPIIVGEKIVLQCDVLNGAFWASFDAETGRELRRVERKESATWATPAVIESGGRMQLVLNGWKHMGGYDLETGEELWKLSGGGDLPVPAPQAANGVIYITNGHGRSPIYAIRPDARGDLTPREGDAEKGAAKHHDGLLWWKPRHGSYMPTPLVLGDNLYVANDNGVITAFDARSGEERFRTRIEGAGTFSASVVAADGRLYFASEDGDVFVLKAGNSYELLARNSMGEVCMATPAISDGLLLVRTRGHLYAIGRKGDH